MFLMDLVPYEPEAVGSSDFVMLGSVAGFIATVCAVIAVIAVAGVLIVNLLRKKK